MPKNIEQVFAEMTAGNPAIDLVELLQELESRIGRQRSVNMLLEFDFGFTSMDEAEEALEDLPGLLQDLSYSHMTPNGVRTYYTAVVSPSSILKYAAIPGATVGDVIGELLPLEDDDLEAISGVGLGENLRNR